LNARRNPDGAPDIRSVYVTGTPSREPYCGRIQMSSSTSTDEVSV
jgi:hypothetical protein